MIAISGQRLCAILFNFQVPVRNLKVVKVEPDALYGGVAQLGEHLLCKQGVRSSILLISTNAQGRL